MAVVATLLADPIRVARLSAALRNLYFSTACETWQQLFSTIESRAVSIVVLDPQLAKTAAGVVDPLRTLRRKYSALAIVAYVEAPPIVELDLFEYGRLGLDAIAVKDRSDSPRALRAIIERAEARGLLDPIRRALGDINPTVRDAILMAISRAHERLSPDSIARGMGISRARLATQLGEEGFPSPHPLIAWGRLIVASRMLEDERRSANSVAAALEYPSGSAFRNACQRYLGSTPVEIRERGGARHAVRVFFESAKRSIPTFEQQGEAA